MLTMFDKYYLEKGVALEPPILFGVQHSYRTRCPKYFAAIPRCRLSFTKIFSMPGYPLVECFSVRIFS